MRPRFSLLVLTGLALASCAEQRAAGVPPVQSTVKLAQPPPSAAPAAPPSAPIAEAPEPRPARSWIDAVRLENWEEARTLLDALPEEELARPEMRYLRARVALTLGDHEKAAKLFAGLEKELPDLESDIVRRRAEAAVEAGPFEEAAAYFSKSRSAADLVRAARAYAKAGDPKSALRVADKAIYLAHRAKDRLVEAKGRFVRGGLREAQGWKRMASAEYRWVALSAPETEEARDAALALERLGKPLSARELARIEAHAPERPDDEGERQPAKIELDASATPEAPAEAPEPKGAAALHDAATELYGSRRFAEAAEAFLKAAATRTARRPEQLYFAARALTRVGRADEAIPHYAEVASKYKRSLWAEKASYMAARTLLLRGRYKEALEGYDAYLKNYPRGEQRDSVEYDRALALVSSDTPKAARAPLAKLASRARGYQHRALLREIEGVAAMRAGDREGALRIWNEVVRTQPMSFAALVARGRIAKAGVEAPPLLEPSKTPRPAEPLEVALPKPASIFASVGLDAEAEAALASSERRLGLPYAGRGSEAVCAMYGKLSTGMRRYRFGASQVGFHALLRAPSAGERWAWECVYPTPYAGFVGELEREHGIPKGLVHAVMRQESAFNPGARSPVSAQGLMQLMPATAQKAAAEIGMKLDPADVTVPHVNIRLGAYYLGKLLGMFQGNVVLATASYNAGPNAVSSWLAPGADNDVDLWVARIPYTETRNYVALVSSNLARYQWLEGGEEAVAALPMRVPDMVEVPDDAY